MKNCIRILYVIVFALILSVMACLETAEVKQVGPDEQKVYSELINTYNDMAIQNAIISQHTLYPYHFINNSEKMNELGLRDFGVLASHFVENPGSINIRQGSIEDELYYKRVQFVAQKLQDSGVEVNRVSVEDGLPGGSGVTTERVLKILEQPMKMQTSTGAMESYLEN